MRRLLQPRFWISLLLGIAAGLLVGMLPPQPTGTLELHLPEVAEKHAVANVLGVSSDGRYVLIRHGQSPFPHGPIYYLEDESIVLWDRQNASEPLVAVAPGTYCTPLLSPDASVCCVITGVGEKSVEAVDGRLETVPVPRNVTLHELPSGQVLKQFELLAQSLFFTPDGKLMAVEDRVVREAESGRVVQRLPAKIDNYEFKHTLGAHAVYATHEWMPGHLRIYSCLTGELQCSATLPTSDFVTQVCGDGKVVCWVQRSWNNIGLRVRHPSKIVDASSGDSRDFNRSGFDQFAVASPDGEDFAHLDNLPPAPKWLRWLPIRQGGKCVRIVRWRTQTELAVLPGVKEVCFSADGKQLAAVRTDNTIEFYDYPLRKPWWLIAGAALVAAGFTWSIGWLWSRWRARGAVKPSGGAA